LSCIEIGTLRKGACITIGRIGNSSCIEVGTLESDEKCMRGECDDSITCPLYDSDVINSSDIELFLYSEDGGEIIDYGDSFEINDSAGEFITGTASGSTLNMENAPSYTIIDSGSSANPISITMNECKHEIIVERGWCNNWANKILDDDVSANYNGGSWESTDTYDNALAYVFGGVEILYYIAYQRTIRYGDISGWAIMNQYEEGLLVNGTSTIDACLKELTISYLE
jgi:hypothetical protein